MPVGPLPRYARLLALVALSTACSAQGTAETGPARAAAERFAAAVGTDPTAACDLLAPRTRSEVESDGSCPESLPREELGGEATVERVEVYGVNAIVRLAGDTVFLARFADGWRVTAAGCQPTQQGRPYDCAVKGS